MRSSFKSDPIYIIHEKLPTVGEGNGYGALVTGTSSDMAQKGSHSHTWESQDFSSLILFAWS